MNKNNGVIAAIDIGTTKIVSIIGRKDEKGKIEILGMSKAPSKGVKRGTVLNIEETVNTIQQTIDGVKEDSGMVLDDVYVGIAGQHVKSIRNRGYINRKFFDTEIAQEEVDKLIEDMHNISVDLGEEILHVIPQNYIVDHEHGIKNPVGMTGKRLEANFIIVVGQVSSARNIEKCIHRVGLKINDLILEPIASSEAVVTDDEKEAGVALIDIGGGTTDLVVYYDGIIRHTAVIPFGGNVVTSDIKEGCSILLRQAEQLKVQYGMALGDLAPDDKVVTIPGISGREPKEISFKNLAYIIQSRMEEIIDAASFEIETSGFYDKLSAGIVLTGGGSLLKYLPQLVKFKTGLDVRIGYPDEHLAGDLDDDINHPMYSTSVGLLLKGAEMAGQPVKAVHKEAPIEELELIDEPVNQENEEPSQKSGKRIFESIKDTFNKIFDEEDTKM
jgi:cell division protein FtsA